MGAGVSTEVINKAIRKNLKKHSETLKLYGVPNLYKNLSIIGGNDKVNFAVTYHISRASNGEAAIWPVFTIKNKLTGQEETIGREGDERVWTALERGISRITTLYEGE